MKHTDYQKVYELAANILKDDKQLLTLTDDLGQKLRALEGSFTDDGIEEVKSFVNSLTNSLVNAQTSFVTIANELVIFADKLKEGK